MLDDIFYIYEIKKRDPSYAHVPIKFLRGTEGFPESMNCPHCKKEIKFKDLEITKGPKMSLKQNSLRMAIRRALFGIAKGEKALGIIVNKIMVIDENRLLISYKKLNKYVRIEK